MRWLNKKFKRKNKMWGIFWFFWGLFGQIQKGGSDVDCGISWFSPFLSTNQCLLKMISDNWDWHMAAFKPYFVINLVTLHFQFELSYYPAIGYATTNSLLYVWNLALMCSSSWFSLGLALQLSYFKSFQAAGPSPSRATKWFWPLINLGVS